MKLWLDDLRDLPNAEGWIHAHSVNEAIAIMMNEEISFASLDHDLGDYASDGGDGRKFVDWMAEHDTWPSEGIAVHSMNPIGANAMLATIERYAPYAGRRVSPTAYLG